MPLRLQHQSRLPSTAAARPGDRRQDQTSRLGRRATDAWLPYNPAFVAQFLAQANPCAAAPAGPGPGPAGSAVMAAQVNLFA